MQNLGSGFAQMREVMAAKDLPLLDRQLCGVTGHCKLTVSVIDMKEPCLLAWIPFRNAACDDLGRMQRQVRGKAVQLILEAAAEQVESLITSSNVEDERLELHCRVLRKGEVAEATEEDRGGHAAVKSFGGEVNGGAGKAGPALPANMRSGRREAGQQWVQDGGRHNPVFGWMEDEQPSKAELASENQATKVLVEQWETLRVQDSV